MKYFLIIPLLWLFSLNALSAGFDCAKANGFVLEAICADKQLSYFDDLLSESYKNALRTTSDKKELNAEVRNWLKYVRNKCTDKNCLEISYKDRLTNLGVNFNSENNRIAAYDSLPVVSYEQPDDSGLLGLLMLIAFFIIVFACFITVKSKINQRKSDEAAVEEEIRYITENINLIINSHVKTLSLQKKRLVTFDAYGNAFDEKWIAEIEHFISHVICKNKRIDNMLIQQKNVQNNRTNGLSKQNQIKKTWKEERLEANLPTRSEIFTNIDRKTDLYYQQELQNLADEGKTLTDSEIEKLSPIEFEHYCADILKANGWKNVNVTQASGDQGIDVIAEHENLKAVFQCKKYSQPVGNKAVQEIIAGKQFLNAQIASVVTNAAFTPSAKELAKVTGVHLLHLSELRHFAEKLKL